MTRTAIPMPLSPFALIACLLFTSTHVGAIEKQSLKAAKESIKTDELFHHVEQLADDAFRGREAGSEGGHAAGIYISNELKKYGLKPAGTADTYFQEFGRGYRNILAVIPGGDPELKNEIVLICAHYDHVGTGTRSNSRGAIGNIHNGADDNASGTSGLLELSQSLSMLGEAPRRTILIAFWDGEEKGLLGSKHWLSSPTLKEKVAFVINMDMIGRMEHETVKVYGSRSSLGLRRLVCDLHDGSCKLDFPWEVDSNSDHWPFYRRNIPFFMLHTGLHDDYHTPDDDVDAINKEGMASVTRLLFELTCMLADVDKLPEFRDAGRKESKYTQRQFELGAAPKESRLGIWWQPIDKDSPGAIVVKLLSGSAADVAGVKAGDILLEFDGWKITDDDELRRRVLLAVETVKVKVRRADETEEELEIKLQGEPVRIGISWREDPADPSVMYVTRVVPGSVAAASGLEVGDRIYAINDKIFNSSDEFLKLMVESSPAQITCEKDGVLRKVEMEVPELPGS